MEWAITITPIPGSQDCKITTPEGEYLVRGLALFADGGDQNLLSFFWNSAPIAAAACVKSMAQAIRSENQSAIQFYQYLLRFMCRVTGISANEETADEALKRFNAAAELYEAVKTDPKDWN